ncbi:von Willebrand factor type A domain-containing protein [Mycena crocata]|nr:von Willebrand factor type A domain-containing protein [Mycena crocata]
MSQQFWGLHYSHNHLTISLPLVKAHAAATIKELAAQVKLTHIYSNDTDLAPEASYSFPIPARASVFSFAMIKQDGTRVIGKVGEKMEARDIYRSAVAQGKRAALMEQQTPDVFQIAVGNIQPREQVQIELVYATVLTEEEENDSILFHLPVHVGSRYGAVPVPSATQVGGPVGGTSFLDISVNVEAVSPIVKIDSPSHAISTKLGPDPALPNAHELPFFNYARVSLSSEAALDKDFVLTVKSAGLDAPRCVAELHPVHHTTALAFTVVPRFQIPDLSQQEFVFLVDRSGSMNNHRITAAKKALVVMLRSLPANGSLFQVASFGSRCRMLWDDGSRPYNQATLDEATQHVDVMDASYGGTDIREALAHCFAARKLDRPTSLFLLTDGAAWDVNGVLAEVKAAVADCPAQAYLRIFVLGIGNSASTAMCEGIARVGAGVCMLVGEQEKSFTKKIARMLKAARTPMISAITIDWGLSAVQESKVADLTFDDDDAFVMVPGENETGKGKGKEQVQQSPFRIRTLSPGNRLNVYTIIQGKTVPKTVTLSGFAENGSEVRLTVPVTLSALPNAPDASPAIHGLTARKIIEDIEDGQHAIVSSIPDDADLLARTVKASIVRLGKLYSISSSQTSFVAVDESGILPTIEAHSVLNPQEPAEMWKSLSHAFRSPKKNVQRRDRSHEQGVAHAENAGDVVLLPRRGVPAHIHAELQPQGTPPIPPRAAMGEFTDCRRLARRTHGHPRGARPAAVFQRLPGVESIIALAVTPDQARAALCGVAEGMTATALDEVFATVLAMAFLCTKLGADERETWEAMYNKARAYVENLLQRIGSGVGVDELQTQAVTLLV